jgi:hypothetical protein
VLTGKVHRLSFQEKDELKLQYNEKRIAWENKNLGGYTVAYPCENKDVS